MLGSFQEIMATTVWLLSLRFGAGERKLVEQRLELKDIKCISLTKEGMAMMSRPSPDQSPPVVVSTWNVAKQEVEDHINRRRELQELFTAMKPSCVCSKEWLKSILIKNTILPQEKFVLFNLQYERAELRAHVLVEDPLTLLERLLYLLERIEWPESDARQNVMRKDVKTIKTLTLGWVNARQNGCVLSNATQNKLRYAVLFEYLRESIFEHISKHDPSFSYTSITDSNNLGPSYSVSLGDFSGGNLLIRGGAGESHDTRNKWVKFDGNREHSTEPFRGTRYCLVFYCIRWRKCPRIGITGPMPADNAGEGTVEATVGKRQPKESKSNVGSAHAQAGVGVSATQQEAMMVDLTAGDDDDDGDLNLLGAGRGQEVVALSDAEVEIIPDPRKARRRLRRLRRREKARSTATAARASRVEGDDDTDMRPNEPIVLFD